MAPSALIDDESNSVEVIFETHPFGSALLHRNVNEQPPLALSATGNVIHLDNGFNMLDGSCGAAVSCLGHGHLPRLGEAVQGAFKMFYAPSLDYSTWPPEKCAEVLVHTTIGAMSKVIFYSGGSEAVEAGVKLAKQYHCELGDWGRTRIIARQQSYHGATLGCLALSGHEGRKRIFKCLLPDVVSHIPACNPYYDRYSEETDEQYVKRKAQELEDEFQRLGPKSVIAFVMEPVVGAALGCVPAAPGYLGAMRDVCDRHGALLIFDEVMCGIGRTGKMHAWQHEGVAPDIQIVGKGLGAGIQALSATLFNHRVAKVLRGGSGTFQHGHTYQNHPIACAVGLEVLNIIRDDRLLENVECLGHLLEDLLHEKLDSHPNVGNIRGLGFFQGIAFVVDKATKQPFDVDLHVYQRFHEIAKQKCQLYTYPGNGTYDGLSGDHAIIAPPYNATEDDIREIVDRFAKAVTACFDELAAEGAVTTTP
ncbi:aminotransferase, class III [Massariosphaeria phaeospora]|uniref:Aminotransferase, class III n=1 Tax=Massariosphaeria phaeospora TaxID=100035 RepID=A0A7C8MFP2_9PLEO|nr:aminotransferase, class III [Massariosphaeria phaeospora]